MTTTAEHAASDRTHPRRRMRLTILGKCESVGGPEGRVTVDGGIGFRRKLHRHSQCDEVIRIADSELTIRAGRHMAVIRAGGQVTIPAGVAHAPAETGPGASYSLVVSPVSATNSTHSTGIAIALT